ADVVDRHIAAVALALGLDELHRLQERVLPVPDVHLDALLGERELVLVRLGRRARRGAEEEATSALREVRRAMLAHPPAGRDAARALAGDQRRFAAARTPQVERERRLLGVVVVAVGQERELLAGVVPGQALVVALPGERGGDLAARDVDDEDAVLRAVLARRRVRQPLAVPRELVRDDVVEPTLLARGEVAEHERRAVLLLPLRAGASLTFARRLLGRRAVRLGGFGPRHVLLEQDADPARALLGEREGLHPLDLVDPAGGEVQDPERVLR